MQARPPQNPDDGAASSAGPAPRVPGWRERLAAVGKILQDFYAGPYRATFARARRDEEDLFMMMVFSEALGVPNPATYYTVELLPVVYERFHEWHRRMGMERSPLDSLSCC